MADDGDDWVDALLASVGHSHDDETATVSAQARSRRRWLRQQANESSTLTGVLLTLAEREDPLTLHCGHWTHHGRLRAVTAELTIIELTDDAGVVLVPTGAITMVESPAEVADDRLLSDGPDLAAVLATLAPERPAVRLLLEDGSDVAGTLTELGRDVADVRLASSVAIVRLSALVGCVLPSRGNDAQTEGSGTALGSLDDFGSG